MPVIGRQKIQDLERPGQDEHYHGNSPGDWEEGALLSATTTAKSLLDNKVQKSGRLDGARLHSIPIDFTNLPAQVDLPKAWSTLEENGLMQTAHGLSDLEIGIKQTGNTQLKQNKKQRKQSEWVYAGPMGLKHGAKKKLDSSTSSDMNPRPEAIEKSGEEKATTAGSGSEEEEQSTSDLNGK
ncbi:hypothetical protein STEG23_023472 [Scotinomys teguina]